MIRGSHPRRRTVLVAAAVLMLSATVACGAGSGGSQGSPDEAELVMTIWGSENDTRTYQQRADAYTAAHPGVTVAVRNIPIDNYDQQVETMITGGSSPDIVLVSGTRAPGLAARGGILPLDNLLKESNLVIEDHVDPARIDAYRFGGATYALPDRGGSVFLYYNKTMFRKAGVPEPRPGWTWDEFTAAARALTIVEGGQTVQYGAAVDDWPQAVQSVARSFGATMFTDSLDAAAIDSPEYREALTAYVALAQSGVSPTLEDYADFGQNVNRDALFAQQRTAMIWAGPWDIPDFVEQGIDFGIAPPPVAKQGEPTMMALGTGLAVGAHSSNQAAAWKVIEYMFSAEGQRPIVENAQDVPTSLELVPEWVASLPGDVSYDAIAAVPDAVFAVRAPEQIAEVLEQVEQDLYPMFVGTTSVDEATSMAAANIDVILGDR